MIEKHFIISLGEDMTVNRISGTVNRNSNGTQYIGVELDGWKPNEGEELYIELSHYDDDMELLTNVGPLHLIRNAALNRYVTVTPPEFVCIAGQWDFSVELRRNIAEDENGSLTYQSITSPIYNVTVVDSIVSATKLNSYVKETELIAAAKTLGEAITVGNTADEIKANAKNEAVCASLEAVEPLKEEAKLSANYAADFARTAENMFLAAQLNAEQAEKAEKSAKDWADISKQYAQFGIKINTEYNSVEDLPQTGNPQYIYLISNGSTGNNSFDEYMWVESKEGYEKVGTTEVDLTDYATRESLSSEGIARITADEALGARIDGAEAEAENLTAFVAERLTGLSETKADVDGDYPDMSVGYATRADSADKADNDANGNGIAQTYIKKSDLLNMVYPVGAIYISVNPTNPANLFGGSWVSISSGYYLKAVTSGAGAYGDAGLPNITGQIRLRGGVNRLDPIIMYSESDPDTKSFVVNPVATWGGTHAQLNKTDTSGSVYQQLELDASRSDPVFGKSTTVTPKNFSVYMWRRTA